jgi:alkanesulfonate monooxygenase SsuD/methylene tetrahydromethanopterin reductase-like flavin-dependent oxidoreductase (luciferase family)
MMRFGVDVPIKGEYFDPRVLADLAYAAEESGWDGFFVWDHISLNLSEPICDPWVALAAIALRTQRIRIGPMVTPIPRRRPWKLARETVTIDHLSDGRLTLGVGIGSPADVEFESFGEEGDVKVRAAMLDEGLEVLTGLWTGEPLTYRGEHYQLTDKVFLPRPVQTPRIPVWVGANWPNKAPLRRAARWDGVFPIFRDNGNSMTPEVMRAVIAYVTEQRSGDSPFDIVVSGLPPGEDRGEETEMANAYAELGVTWWVAPGWADSVEECRRRISRGPPRL